MSAASAVLSLSKDGTAWWRGDQTVKTIRSAAAEPTSAAP